MFRAAKKLKHNNTDSKLLLLFLAFAQLELKFHC